jgi:pathogenesis-related protein 1
MASKLACLSVALAAVIVLLAATPCARAQSSPQDYLDPQNAARANVGVGPVSWDDKVAAYAQGSAQQRQGDCKLVHSGGPYGENIFWGSGGGDWSAASAVGAWVAEKQNYDHGSNSCAEGQVCGHYTQVVWRDSTTIGCARVVCDENAGVFITCNYNPPGNYVGQSPY